jgi:hypothetical protein
VGVANRNPILDTQLYEVLFDNGSTQEYMANTIFENLYSQVDPEENEYLLLEEITNHHCKYDVISKDDMFLDKEKQMPKRTTKGWDLLVHWKDGTTAWKPSKDLKESNNPVQAAKYKNQILPGG